MEFERRWLVAGYPPDGLYPCEVQQTQHQSYLSTRPTVRVRKTVCKGAPQYMLCIKGKGTLSREEIELPLDAATYARLCALIQHPPIRKEQRVYRLPTGHVLEVSLVDAGTPAAFYYAEVEFASVEEAHAFVPPAFLGAEKTEDASFSMAAHWRATRGASAR